MYQAKLQEENGEDFGKTTCTTEVQAAFILSSFVTFFSGLLILFLCRLLWRIIKKGGNFQGTGFVLDFLSSGSFHSSTLRRLYFYGVFRDRIEMLLSAQTFVGQVLVILVFVLSIGSLIIYFINSTDPVGSCSSYEDKTIPVDLIFNAFFSFYFGLRFLAADDKIKFWLEMNSIVDIFTIPPTFISYYLKSNWLGLRFLRALRLLELPRILQILQAIKTSNSVKFSKLLSIALSTWFTAAGFIHLVENFGDPWLKGRNSQNITYFESIYLVMATTSTVGFGDVVAKTSLGRTFIMFFTLILFANYIPEMVELFANKRKYISSYEVVKGKKFIVVCGNITVDSVTAFLRNFLRHRSGEINTEIVFLGEVTPSLELETIFKCYLAYTTFISGSALKWEDLRRVAVESAEACLIIANPLCSDLHAEDTSNIMRVLSIKNYYPKTRVIIQILQSHNKDFLPKIPSWNWSTGDNIICFAELKLGFMAQGCLVPGLCTFLTSLFVEQNKKISPKQTWQKYFLNSLKNKILTQRLSDDFAGMSFPEVSRLCFVKMNLMLIAIEYKPLFQSGYCGLILNPPAQIKLRKNTLGFFIAESPKEVKRALFYCATCHSDVYNPELIEKCDCKSKSRHHLSGTAIMVMKSFRKSFCGTVASDSFPGQHRSSISFSSLATKTLLGNTEQESDKLDGSGMFHWCKAVPLEMVTLKRSEKSKHDFRNHIIACIFGDAHTALMGLRNFVMPLRASNYTRQELKDIVFLGSLDYMQKEWRFLRNFPHIYILPGSALYPADLQALNIEKCSMCAILAPSSKPSSSQTLVDTETIMATLNIGSLRIVPSTEKHSTKEVCLLDFRDSCGKSKCRRIPTLTELKNPSNIHFIEQIGGLEGNFTGTSLHLSASFSTGAVFSGNFLDSLLATAFYNYRVLELLQMLVTGGVSSQMEQQLDKEKFTGLTDSYSMYSSGRMRCKLGLLSLEQTILSDIQPRTTFGQLFCGSLDCLGILCVGLYRMIDEEASNPEHKRFVITRPANDLKLLPSDLVFCAIPFSTVCEKKDGGSSQPIHEVQNIVSRESSMNANLSYPTAVYPVSESTPQKLFSSVQSMEVKPSFFSETQQATPSLSFRLSTDTKANENVKENEKENMKETLKENAP
uniref:potassium channel subfamily U member 1 isoform X2 n=1 Tax=Ictidomys tridecemlineatus TaxID=43179 RepID=UPI001A9E9F4B|nr:potassium channel subfamily U member 1 isoform X2 [Ictidomys tridecemlineatus]